MTADGEVLYVAYRSWTWLRESDKLRVVQYDLKSRRELRRATIAVPKVHGPRVAEGLYLSKDGQVLAYAETHDPSLVLLVSAKDLLEVRRSTALPFPHDADQPSYTTFKDLFAGFDGSGFLSFAFSDKGLRFMRVDPASLAVASETSTPRTVSQERSEVLVWSPVVERTWTVNGARGWQEYTEDGQATRQEFWGPKGETYGAFVLGEGKLIAFFGRWSHGAVIVYNNHRTAELSLPCVPLAYGASADPQYVGALCAVQQSSKRFLWDKVLSSEFLLINTEGPAVVWRRRMDLVANAERDRQHRDFYQKGSPLVHPSDRKVWIVAPERWPELSVYEVTLPEPKN
jgi:hypothetical protein